jgi:translocation and assembly module TamB
LRLLSRRRVAVFFSLVAVVLLALIGGILVYINSPAFEEKARQYIVREIEKRTGAQVSLARFEANFREQRFRLRDLNLRGLESPETAPLAHFDHIDIGLNLRSLLQRRIDLFELSIYQPAFHIVVGPDGKTNFPSPEPRPDQKPLNFQISIENFSLVGGAALLNERRVAIDFSLRNLVSGLKYNSNTQVLSTQLRYDGVLDRSDEGMRSIPYTLNMDSDYVRATLVAHTIIVQSTGSEIKLQGKINQLLNRNINGRLEYVGTAAVPFLNYFFTKEQLAGKADVAGFLEFSPGYFFTRGNTVSDAVTFEGWHATNVRGDYTYHYPEKRISFRKMKSRVVDGAVSGDIVIENVPGTAKVLLDLDYNGINAADLAKAYPWDPKYRIYSKLTGSLNGWFEGKLDRYEFSGHAALAGYKPPAVRQLIALPLTGSTDYNVRPGQARVTNTKMQFYSTAVQADGLIHKTASQLKVVMQSSDLRNLAFLYGDANGQATFDGTLSGPISTPLLAGMFTLQDHVYRDWKIQYAAGGVRLNTKSEMVDLQNVQLTEGQSEATLNGSVALAGAPVDLRLSSARFKAEDLRMFVKQDIGGTFAGNLHITSISPSLRVEGDVTADDLVVEQRVIGDATGHIRYFDRVIEVDRVSLKRRGTTVTGSASFNQATEALTFMARLNSLDIAELREFGLPQSISGVIRQAELRGEGTVKQPNVRGEAAIQDLVFYGEAFPQARIRISSSGSKADVQLDAARNLNLTAQVDVASAGYPFTAKAMFTQYPLQRIAGLSEGSVTATGSATFSGLVTDLSHLSGEGRIENAEARIQQQTMRTSKPFTFDFNSTRLNVSGVSITGQATQVSVAGTIGLAPAAPLNFNVSGRVDLGLISAAYPEWLSTGTVNVEGRIAGTVQTPDLRGVAHLANASLGRHGFFTTLTNFNGDLFFDQDRVTLSNIVGRLGGGTVRAAGTALLQHGSLQAMNIQIDTDDVRVRYPEGLRTIVDGSLNVRGPLSAPLLEGNLQIQSLSYRSSFEEFLALLTERTSTGEASPLDQLRLAVHVEGGRNITIQNQLAEVEARIDVDVKGTLANPSLTGHVEASGGTLSFQGNRYRVTRGNIDFVDPLRIEPVVDVQAESEVRDYRVILSITGRGQNLHLDMRSDPPLPELEIVSLIAGGRTREEYAARAGAGSAVPTSEQLFQSGAASILFDLLQKRVGSRLGLFGLDRVRVDPFLVGAENNPGARITLSEQVTKDLSITYSQDLSSNRQQIIIIEYFIDRNTSIVASRDELGNFGLDVRRRARF